MGSSFSLVGKKVLLYLQSVFKKVGNLNLFIYICLLIRHFVCPHCQLANCGLRMGRILLTFKISIVIWKIKN